MTKLSDTRQKFHHESDWLAARATERQSDGRGGRHECRPPLQAVGQLPLLKPTGPNERKQRSDVQASPLPANVDVAKIHAAAVTPSPPAAVRAHDTCAAVTAAVLAAAGAPVVSLALQAGGRLLPDSCGRISHLALQFGNVEFGKPLPVTTVKAVLNLYKTLFLNMHPTTRFTIVTADKMGAAACRKLADTSGMRNPERVHVIDAQSRDGMSIWIRDSMLPVLGPDGGTSLLVQDRTYWVGADDSKAARLIADCSHLACVPHPAVRVDGGNILSNLTRSFVGRDSVTQTAELIQQSLDADASRCIVNLYESHTGLQVKKEDQAQAGRISLQAMWQDLAHRVLQATVRRPLLVLGLGDTALGRPAEQPAFHIDMVSTPVGEDAFLVGHPRQAIQVLEGLTPSQRQFWSKRMAEAAGLSAGADVVGELLEHNRDVTQQADFDHLADELRRAGYAVDRTPYLSGIRGTWRLPYITYNNCLQERYTDESGRKVRRVYLPQYHVEPLDALARSRFAGYEIVRLPLAAITLLEGAIRCSAYPISRTHVPSTS